MLSRRQMLATALGLPVIARAHPGAISAQSSASGTPADSTLAEFLALSPSSIANISMALPLVAGNPQLQAETLGITLPFDPSNDEQVQEWAAGMRHVSYPMFIGQNGLQEDFAAITGFEIGQVTAGAEAGEAPNLVTFVRGTFDPAAMEATWIQNGYQQVEVAGKPVFSLSADGKLDLLNPVTRMTMGRMNNLTFLDDGTLACALTLDLIQQVLEPQGSLLDQPGVRPALNTLDTPLITSLVHGPGAFLAAPNLDLFLVDSQDDIMAAMEALREQASSTEPAPIVVAAILGDTPGGPLITIDNSNATPVPGEPVSVSKFALAYFSPEDAQTAADQIQQRLETGSSIVTQEPWTSMFSEWSVEPNLEQSSVLLTTTWTTGPGRSIDLVFRRDLGFITG